MADNYHHKNLKQALIDAGIKIINENGEEKQMNCHQAAKKNDKNRVKSWQSSEETNNLMISE